MPKPPHITLLKSTLSQLGGLEKYSLRLANHFLEKGCFVTLLTTGHPSSLPHTLCELYSHSFTSRTSVCKILEYDRFCQQYLSKHPSDVVFSLDRNRSQTHLRAGNGVHAAYLASRKTQEGLLKSASFAINPLHRLLLHFEKKAFEDPNLKTLFTNSAMVKEQILSYYRTDPEKIHVVHNGVEWNEMKDPFEESLSRKSEIAASLGLDPSHFHFVFIGSNFQRKGLELLLKALSRISPRHFTLSVLGKDKNLPKYQQLCQTLGIEKSVRFWGPRKEIFPFYQMADCLVIPSLYDPFANVTVEALSMGLTVVSSRQNGGHEVLTPENGLIIPDLFDLDSFTETLNLSLKRPKTVSLSQKIRASVQSLDFPNQLDKIISRCL